MVKIEAKNSLGRGLSSLLPQWEEEAKIAKSFEFIPLKKIKPNPFQPRRVISIESVIELSDSIKEIGVMTPILVSRSSTEGEYLLVAGERRLRASELAGLTEIPALIKQLSDQDMAEIAIIENIHRKDLTAVEEGYAFVRLASDFKLTYEQIAQKISKTKTYVDNKIRLTRLPEVVQHAISNEEISELHGRLLASLEEETAMVAALKIVIRDKLSSSKTEELVRQIKTESAANGKELRHSPTLEWLQKFDYIKENMQSDFGWNVKLKKNSKNGGALMINFNNDDELVSIYRRIAGEG